MTELYMQSPYLYDSSSDMYYVGFIDFSSNCLTNSVAGRKTNNNCSNSYSEICGHTFNDISGKAPASLIGEIQIETADISLAVPQVVALLFFFQPQTDYVNSRLSKIQVNY